MGDAGGGCAVTVWLPFGIPPNLPEMRLIDGTEFIGPPDRRKLRTRAWEQIAEVTAKHGIPMSVIRSETHQRIVVEARADLADRLRRRASLSLPIIGRLMNRDHTTILNLLRRGTS